MIEGISYEQATQYASDKMTAANNMKTILEDVDRIMADVNADWEGQAAESTYGKYLALKKNFEGFYNQNVKHSKFITDTVAAYKAADTAIKNKSEELLNSEVA